MEIPRHPAKKQIDEPNIEFGTMCKEHSMLLHSFDEDTGKPVCDKCISTAKCKNIRTLKCAKNHIERLSNKVKILLHVKRIEAKKLLARVSDAKYHSKQ